MVNINWIVPNDQFSMANDQLKVKVRHGKSSHPCTVKPIEEGVQVTLKKPVHGIAPGQFAVFYLPADVFAEGIDGEYCLGGGMIT